ncbi:MAG: glycosyltransferase [Pseudomonadota bacterium]
MMAMGRQPSLIERAKWRARRHLIPAPKAEPHRHLADAPVVVAGLFSTASGIGESARLCAQNIRRSGLEVTEIDLSGLFNQVDFTQNAPCLTPIPDTRNGTLIVHLNAPELDAALFRLRHQLKPTWRIIGYWAWELSNLPEDWRDVTRHLTEIWTPSDFVSDVIRGVVDVPVVTVPHVVVPPKNITRQRDADLKLAACIMADGRSSFERKNVMGSIEMFRAAFPSEKDVRLNVKLRNLSEFPDYSATVTDLVREDSRIHLIDETHGQSGKWDLLGRCDTILSAHRAEGFGLHLAEAMSIGLVPVATNWSGNTQFMCKTTACLLDYSLVPARDPFGVYDDALEGEWAVADLRKGIEGLRAMAANRDWLSNLAHNAATQLPRRLSADAYVNALGIK